MGKRRKPESGKRRRPGLSRAVLWSSIMSVSSIVLAATLALAGVGTPPAPVAIPAPTVASSSVLSSPTEIVDPYAKDQILASESLSAETPALGDTTTLLGAPSPTSAPATGSPVRISAIRIERPARAPLTPATVTPVAPDTTPATAETVTETVVVAAPEAEEEVVEEAEVEEPVEAGTVCMPPRGKYNGVRDDIAVIGAHIQDRFGVTEVVGKAGRSNASEHPIGLALDFMTNTGNVDGDAINAYLLEKADEFGVKYVIWQKKITFPGKDPRDMEDRGGDTANHRDHVHVSFNDSPGSEAPTC